MGNDGIQSENKGEWHVPVLAEEVLSWLDCRPGRRYLDCTVGYAGLARNILKSINPDGRLVAIDRDEDAIVRSRELLGSFEPMLHLIHGNFTDLKRHLAQAGIERVHGVVFDLGLSSPQLDRPERGFSFQAGGPLDMRMDQTQGETAAELIERLSERELADIIRRYGEERFAQRIARAIVRARDRESLRTTQDLASTIRSAVPVAYRHGRVHVATRTFQAIRIAVNREMDGLAEAFRDAVDVLSPGGRLCVISFHSLEDRIAKQTIKALSTATPPLVRVLTKKPQTATESEKARNPRARSAKLRVAERLPGGKAA